MRRVYGMALMMASGLAAVACAESPRVTLQSQYDESKSVAAGAAVATPVAGAAQVAAVGVAPVPVSATATMTAGEAKALIESYFSGIKTLRAQFTQTTTGEAFSQEGVFYLKKPRQFLWRYETPLRQKIVGTGSGIYYHDEETNQVTQLPANSGVTKFFTEGRLDLEREGIAVERVVDGPVETTVWLRMRKKAGGMGDGEVTAMKLVFGKNPRVLRVLEATDVTGAVTSIRLNDVVKNAAVDAKLFKFVPPQYRDR